MWFLNQSKFMIYQFYDNTLVNLPRLLVSCWESQMKRTQRGGGQLSDQLLWCNLVPENWLASLEIYFPVPLHLGMQVISSPLPNGIFCIVLLICNDIYGTGLLMSLFSFISWIQTKTNYQEVVAFQIGKVHCP